MTEHAKLSASSSERWTNCPGSVLAESKLPPSTSKYAEEGSLAHTIAAKYLLSEIDTPCNSEMRDAIDSYVKYVRGLQGTLYIEQKVDFSNIVPEGFGTADAIVVVDDELHIVDFKYGKGVEVLAYENTQCLLYAIGAINTFKFKNIDKITLHIAQPRIHNFSSWTITYKELEIWMRFFAKKAKEALDPFARRIPSEKACKFCKAKNNCPALFDYTTSLVMKNFDVVKQREDITDKEVRVIVDNAKLITDFIASLEARIYDSLLTGRDFVGYKLVKGRSYRKFKDDPEVEKTLVRYLQEEAYEKKLICATKAEKLLDNEIFNSLVEKTYAKLIIAKEDDKRCSVDVTNIFEIVR